MERQQQAGSGMDLLKNLKSVPGSHLMTKRQQEEILKELQTSQQEQQKNMPLKPPRQNMTYINEDSIMNFQKWVLILVSFASMVLTATLIFLGFSSSSFIEHTMYADKALVLLGSLACVLNLSTILATIYNKKRTLLLIVYMDFVMIAYLLTYSFGCITFQPNMQQWIYTNWEEIVGKVQTRNMVQFQQDIENQILSLGVTALTLSIGFAISIFCIVLRLKLSKIMVTFAPAFAIMFIVFGSGLLWLAIYALVHLDFIDIPFWMNTFSLCLGGTLMLIGLIGYFATIFHLRFLTIFYLCCVGIITLLILMCCVAYFVLSNSIDVYVDQYWPSIRSNLDKAGIWMPRSTFQSGLIMNVKFLGLYGISFFFFLAFGLAGSIYYVATSKED